MTFGTAFTINADVIRHDGGFFRGNAKKSCQEVVKTNTRECLGAVCPHKGVGAAARCDAPGLPGTGADAPCNSEQPDNSCMYFLFYGKRAGSDYWDVQTRDFVFITMLPALSVGQFLKGVMNGFRSKEAR